MNQNVKVQIVQSVTRVRGVTPTGPMGPAGPKGDKGDKGDPGPPGADGADGADGVVQAIVAGSGILVDSSDPAAPEISLDTITADQIVVDDDVFVNIAGEDLATVLADIDTQIASSGGGGGGITVEDALDAVGNALVEGDNISIAVDDGNDTITIGVTGLTAEDIEFTPTAPWEAENVQEGIEELQDKASIVDLQVLNLNSALINKQDADVLLSDIANLSDPGADRLLFWDDSADEITWLTLGSNLSITGTTLNASGGGGGGAVDSVNGQTGDVTLTYEDVGAAPGVHGHEIEDVDGLDTALAGKANSSHTHSTSDITSLAEFIRDTLPHFDVTDYGAVGDGSTDDSAAIQAAIDAADDAGGGVVLGHPGHTYDIGTTWPVISGTGRIVFNMQGGMLRALGSSSTVLLEVAGRAGQAVAIVNTRFEGFGATSGDIGLRVTNSQSLIFDRLRFTFCQTGIDLVNDGAGPGNAWNEQHRFSDIEMTGCGVGVDMRIVNGGTSSFAGSRFYDVTISNTGTHFQVGSGASFYGGLVLGWVGFFSAAGTQVGFNIQGSAASSVFQGRMEETGASSTPRAVQVGASGSVSGTDWRFHLTGTGFLDPPFANGSSTSPRSLYFVGSGAGSMAEISRTFGTSSLDTLTLTNDLAVAHGGTGASDAATARANLGAAAISHTHTASDVTDFAAATRAVTAVHVINAQTGTSYTAVADDAGKIVTLDNSSPITFTIPPNSSVAFDVGTRIDLIQTGEGQVTITPGSGVTVNGTPGTKLRAQHSAASVVKVATDTWQAIGDLAA